MVTICAFLPLHIANNCGHTGGVEFLTNGTADVPVSVQNPETSWSNEMIPIYCRKKY